MAEKKIFGPKDFEKPKRASVLPKILMALSALLVCVGLYWCCGRFINVDSPIITGTPIDSSDISMSPPLDSTIVEGPENPNGNPEVEIGGQNSPNPGPSKRSESVSFDLEVEAINVIRGDYGNVPERRRHLGERYQPIQDRVNQLKREGFF